MWGGCVEIVLGFDTKDCWLAVAWRLKDGCGGVEVELFLSIGWSWRIRDVGRLSRNRVVLVFDPKDG